MAKDQKAKFLKAYANVPDRLRDDIIVIVEAKTYSWNTAYFEIKNSTKLSEKLIKQMSLTGIV